MSPPVGSPGRPGPASTHCPAGRVREARPLGEGPAVCRVEASGGLVAERRDPQPLGPRDHRDVPQPVPHDGLGEGPPQAVGGVQLLRLERHRLGDDAQRDPAGPLPGPADEGLAVTLVAVARVDEPAGGAAPLGVPRQCRHGDELAGVVAPADRRVGDGVAGAASSRRRAGAGHRRGAGRPGRATPAAAGPPRTTGPHSRVDMAPASQATPGRAQRRADHRPLERQPGDGSRRARPASGGRPADVGPPGVVGAHLERWRGTPRRAGPRWPPGHPPGRAGRAARGADDLGDPGDVDDLPLVRQEMGDDRLEDRGRTRWVAPEAASRAARAAMSAASGGRAGEDGESGIPHPSTDAGAGNAP